MTTCAEPIIINHQKFDHAAIRVLELHADYVCGNSGKCCTKGWRIPVHGREHETIRAKLAAEGAPQGEVAEGIARVATGAGTKANAGQAFQLKHDACGRCHFVDGEAGATSCTLHGRFGHETLPLICQSYPRLAVQTPAGIYLTLTYTCPTAAKLLLKEGGLREVAPRRVTALRPKLGGHTIDDKYPAPEFAPGVRPEWMAFDYFWRWATEWMARPELTPAQALYTIGLAVEAIEKHAAQVATQGGLSGLLDSFSSNPMGAFEAVCGRIAPSTELGVVYMDTLMTLLGRVGQMGEEMAEVWVEQAEALKGRTAFIEDYDRLVRPRVAEYERIERNYVGSRLFGNGLVYRSRRLRTGYFTGVLSLVALRFTVLAICRSRGVEPGEEVWLEAAGLTDTLLKHNGRMQEEFLELLEKTTQTELGNLMRPALF